MRGESRGSRGDSTCAERILCEIASCMMMMMMMIIPHRANDDEEKRYIRIRGMELF